MTMKRLRSQRGQALPLALGCIFVLCDFQVLLTGRNG